VKLLAALAVAALTVGAGGSATALPAPAHVIVIVFENKDASTINVRSAPAFSALGRRYARLTNYHAVTHPSLPNYLALVSGSAHGITTDCTTCHVRGDSVGDQLTREGRSWFAFAEGYPAGAGFAKKHVPFLYFSRGASHVRPLSAFDAQQLPDFSFVVPNLCHDMHDCSVATGDRWLGRFVQPLLSLPDTVVFVVFDEGVQGNLVAALVLGEDVRPYAVSKQRVDHYTLLHTIEEMWGLPPLGAAAKAGTIAGIWR
jgi:phosphatidylinositol-3-phosphatase